MCLINIDVITRRISHPEHLPPIWTPEWLLRDLYSQNIFNPFIDTLYIIHFQLEMNRSILREWVFLAQQDDHTASRAELQSTVVNSFIPAIEHLQTQNILVESFAGFIMPRVHV